MSEKLCLQWNDFKENVTSAFGSLREDNDFADVTLACEDGTLVETQKVILAASSLFFQNLLRRNKHHHPLIYLIGMIYMIGIKSEVTIAMWTQIFQILLLCQNKAKKPLFTKCGMASGINPKGLTAGRGLMVFMQVSKEGF